MNNQTPNMMGMTGGPGGIGSTNIANPILNSVSQSVEQFAVDYAYQGLVGATGGSGAIPPTVEEAHQKGITMSTMREELYAQVDKLENTDEIIDALKAQNTEYHVVEGKANAQVAYCAYRMGFYLRRLQTIRRNRRDWGAWSEKNVGFISKRSREKYMNIAGLPGVEMHLAYGVELLSEVGSVYSSLEEKEAFALGSDPIATLLKSRKFTAETPYEERKLHLDAVIQVKKLERN